MQEILTVNILIVIRSIVILVGGWLAAQILASMIQGLLHKTHIDNKLVAWLSGEKEEKRTDIKVEYWISRGVYYVLMLVVFVAFFQNLGLTAVTEPLNNLLDQLLSYVPRLVSGGLLLSIAWLLATLVKLMLNKGLDQMTSLKSLEKQVNLSKKQSESVTHMISETVYWLIFLFFLPQILDALALDGLLYPVQNMIDEMFSYLPNIAGALLFLVVGWVIARVVQKVVSNFLSAAGLDTWSKNAGLSHIFKKNKLSEVSGTIVYIFILVPVIISALDTLQLKAITDPASRMLERVFLIFPDILGAISVLLLSLLLGRFVSNLVTDFLSNIGFDDVIKALGIKLKKTARTPSQIVGGLVLIGISTVAVMEAFRVMGLLLIADLMAQLVIFSANVLLGVTIILVGLYLAKVAYNTVKDSGVLHNHLLATIARVAIIALASAMGLGQMGVAGEIINVAFTLTLGSITLALAIAFGIGGKDTASKIWEDMYKQLKKK